MQSFQKKLLKKSTNRKKQQLYDDYEKQILNTSKKVGQLQKQAIAQLSTSSQVINFFGRTYILIFTAIISSTIAYPLSVRIVKKVFRLKSFFNIHFAIIPIMANWNALLLGMTQGYINYYQVSEKYPIKRDQQMKNLESLL